MVSLLIAMSVAQGASLDLGKLLGQAWPAYEAALGKPTSNEIGEVHQGSDIVRFNIRVFESDGLSKLGITDINASSHEPTKIHGSVGPNIPDEVVVTFSETSKITFAKALKICGFDRAKMKGAGPSSEGYAFAELTLKSAKWASFGTVTGAATGPSQLSGPGWACEYKQKGYSNGLPELRFTYFMDDQVTEVIEGTQPLR